MPAPRSTPVLLALTGSALEASVVVALQGPQAGVHIVRRCVDVADLVATAATGTARAALVAADLPRLDADVVADLRAAHVQPLGVVTDEDEPSASHRLHRMGIGAVVTAGGEHDLAAQVVERLSGGGPDLPEPAAAGPSAGDAVPAGLGRVVAVWGPTGAPGRTTVAVGLAAELAELGRTALLVDADVYGGSVAQHLGILDDVSGVLAAARNAKVGALEPSVLAAHCRQAGRLRVLTGLPRPDRWPELSPAAVAAVLAAARELAGVVVVDCGFSVESEEELMFDTAAPRRNGATLCVLEQADRVLAVGSADPVGLSRLARAVVDLAAALPSCEQSVVVNRMRGGLGWSAAEATAVLERFTGRRPLAVLPDDRAACDRALVHGRTLAECAPGSPLRARLRGLAGDLAGVGGAGDGRRGRRRRPRAVS
jgi:MinD-like ATPase involved in chromosome partitioning or flagellar assembly